MTKINLKQCPFCGNTVDIVYHSICRTFYVYHNGSDNDCSFEMSLDSENGIKSLEDAKKAWNTRVCEILNKHNYLGEHGNGANILLSTESNDVFSICLEDEYHEAKSKWEMSMTRQQAEKVARKFAEMTGIMPIKDKSMSDFDFSDTTKSLIKAFREMPENDVPDILGEYKSPIQTIVGQIEMTMEGETLKACQRVGVNVDKDELVKALNYDRQQYERGFRAGYETGLKTSQKEVDKFIGYLDDDMIQRIKIAIGRREGNGTQDD